MFRRDLCSKKTIGIAARRDGLASRRLNIRDKLLENRRNLPPPSPVQNNVSSASAVKAKENAEERRKRLENYRQMKTQRENELKAERMKTPAFKVGLAKKTPSKATSTSTAAPPTAKKALNFDFKSTVLKSENKREGLAARSETIRKKALIKADTIKGPAVPRSESKKPITAQNQPTTAPKTPLLSTTAKTPTVKKALNFTTLGRSKSTMSTPVSATAQSKAEKKTATTPASASKALPARTTVPKTPSTTFKRSATTPTQEKPAIRKALFERNQPKQTTPNEKSSAKATKPLQKTPSKVPVTLPSRTTPQKVPVKPSTTNLSKLKSASALSLKQKTFRRENSTPQQAVNQSNVAKAPEQTEDWNHLIARIKAQKKLTANGTC